MCNEPTNLTKTLKNTKLGKKIEIPNYPSKIFKNNSILKTLSLFFKYLEYLKLPKNYLKP